MLSMPCIFHSAFSGLEPGTMCILLVGSRAMNLPCQNGLLGFQVFTHVAAGFADTSAFLRELTLKAMLILAPKVDLELQSATPPETLTWARDGLWCSPYKAWTGQGWFAFKHQLQGLESQPAVLLLPAMLFPCPLLLPDVSTDAQWAPPEAPLQAASK